MSDIIDDAQVAEARFLDCAIAKALQVADPAPTLNAPKYWEDGFCRGCGDAIDPERRAAQPTAKRCLQCQEACERRERGL